MPPKAVFTRVKAKPAKKWQVVLGTRMGNTMYILEEIIDLWLVTQFGLIVVTIFNFWQHNNFSLASSLIGQRTDEAQELQPRHG